MMTALCPLLPTDNDAIAATMAFLGKHRPRTNNMCTIVKRAHQSCNAAAKSNVGELLYVDSTISPRFVFFRYRDHTTFFSDLENATVARMLSIATVQRHVSPADSATSDVLLPLHTSLIMSGIDDDLAEAMEQGFASASGNRGALELVPGSPCAMLVRTTSFISRNVSTSIKHDLGSYDVSIRPLSIEDAKIVNANWAYKSERSEAYIVDIIQSADRTLPGSCLGVFENDVLVAWVLCQKYGAIGMLHTLESHRKRGFARTVVSALCDVLEGAGEPAFCYIVDDNAPSQKLFSSLGFEPVARARWVFYKPPQLRQPLTSVDGEGSGAGGAGAGANAGTSASAAADADAGGNAVDTVLCLHGNMQNGQMLRERMGGLRRSLKGINIEYPDGPVIKDVNHDTDPTHFRNQSVSASPLGSELSPASQASPRSTGSGSSVGTNQRASASSPECGATVCTPNNENTQGSHGDSVTVAPMRGWWDTFTDGDAAAAGDGWRTGIAGVCKIIQKHKEHSSSRLRGVFAFSQGADVVATLLAIRSNLTKRFGDDTASAVNSGVAEYGLSPVELEVILGIEWDFVVLVAGKIPRYTRLRPLFLGDGAHSSGDGGALQTGDTRCLFCYGETDRVIPLDWTSALAKCFDGAQVYVHAKGHLIPTDAAFRKTLTAFMRL